MEAKILSFVHIRLLHISGHQEVVTYKSPVEVFVTRIKIESSNQSPFENRSRDQGNLWIAKINESRMQGCNLSFELLKIKQARVSEGNDQAYHAHFLPIKVLDLGHKHFNRLHELLLLGHGLARYVT